jgi:hypothetical protein
MAMAAARNSPLSAGARAGKLPASAKRHKRVLDTFPKLEVMLPRAGGNVPWGIIRLDRTVERMPQLAQAKRPATVYLKRFYYDCIIESPLPI